jgi:hypothetical protein
MKTWKHKSVIKLLVESQNSDPIEEIRVRARNLVLQGFGMGWSGPPFSPIDLAGLLGLDIIPNDSVMDAKLVPLKKNQMQIQYNPFQKPSRINFSIAHEIAHTLFSDCEEEVRNREDDPIANRELEQLCNIGAAEIQLPYAVFSNDANKIEPTIEGLLELSSKYEASLESVLIRYTEVVAKACGLLIGVLQEEGKIEVDYWKSSRTFPFKIDRGYIIPKTSKVYECIAPGWTSRNSERWAAFGNNELQMFSIGISSYKRDKKPRVACFFVPQSSSNTTDPQNRIALEYGDATKPRGKGRKIIAHIVNTSGGMGIGFGKSLSKNFPCVKTGLESWALNKPAFHLGATNTIQASDEIYIFQMLAQKGLFPKYNEIPLKYDSLRQCLQQLAEKAIELKASVHMPQIGAGQAKGDWEIIQGMIYEELVCKGIEVNVYLLPGKISNIKRKSTLTLFNEVSTWQTEKLY